jgi:bacterial/archaeal transporter family-2 protein
VDRLAYVVLPLIGGVLLAAQAPINARLRLVVDSAVGSALVSFVIGAVLLAVIAAVVGDFGNITSGLGGGPWWAYLGGACGAGIVFATLVASPQVGVTATFVAVIMGQVACAAVIDRFGLLGQKVITLDAERLVALGLLAVSLVLLARPR